MKLRVRQSLWFSFLAALLFSVFPVFAHAQSDAALSGHVTDRSGAAISGTLIVAEPINHPQNTFRTRTVADGSYSLGFPPGAYRVSITSPQMADVEQEFTFNDGQRREWNVRMELAPLSSKVVVSAQAAPAPANTVASPVTVLTREQIDQLQSLSLSTLLSSTSGAAITRLGPLGGVTSFFLDGGNSNFTKILIDGAPVNEPGGDIDLSNFDVTNVDKIEIVHGATSALFGSDAVDGVVQIFTHEGTTEQPAVTLLGEGGTFNTRRAEADMSGVLGKFDYAPAVSYLGDRKSVV